MEHFEIGINDDLAKKDKRHGINKLAYTDNPAIEVKGFAFKNQERRAIYFKNELKLRVAAPALIPDKRIYRYDEKTETEFTVSFTKEKISDLVGNFKSKHVADQFNLEHVNVEGETIPSYILEDWIIESTEDKAYSVYGFDQADVPVGSWVVVSQFTDKEIFMKEIVEKERYAYSVEGVFELLQVELSQMINKNKTESMKVPNGVHEIDGKFYKFEDGNVVAVSDVELVSDEEEEKETLATEEEEAKAELESKDKEEDLESEEEYQEEESEEDESEGDSDEDEESDEPEVYTKEEVDSKFEEVYEKLGEIVAQLAEGFEEEKEDEEMGFGKVALSLSQKISAIKKIG